MNKKKFRKRLQRVIKQVEMNLKEECSYGIPSFRFTVIFSVVFFIALISIFTLIFM